MRIFLDTNVLISALTTRGLCTELFEVVLQSHELMTSESVLQELHRVLLEKFGQPEEVVVGFGDLIRTEAVVIDEPRFAPSLPDPDDEPIVGSALAGSAAVFVTGDKVLLKIRRIRHLRIVSPRGLWEELAGWN